MTGVIFIIKILNIENDCARNVVMHFSYSNADDQYSKCIVALFWSLLKIIIVYFSLKLFAFADINTCYWINIDV